MAMVKNLSYPLILASASPRRRELLHQAGYCFEVVAPPVPEPHLPGEHYISAPAWAEGLAYFKARAVSLLYPDAIVIGADTVVTHGGGIVGKAKDKADARRILTNMFGGRNDVITGLAVLSPGGQKRIITHVRTTLIMRDMEPQEIEEYLVGGAWKDKAGAYAIQEGGDKFVQSIEGSFSNIVGLPMEKLGEILRQI